MYLKSFLLFLLLPVLTHAQNCRYYQRIFPSVTKTSNLSYGVAPAITAVYISEATTTSQTLTLDLFQPNADTASKRAMIIFAHSGGFINGTKDNPDMQALCDSFAHLGYVTATINYRLNFNLLSSNSSERAVWRGVQDASAAVRFFKNNASLYKIDTNNIFFWGSSAGAFMSLGLAYLDDAERPSSTYSAFLQPDLGCKDCTGNNYNFTSKVAGIVSCWGATKDTAWIKNNNNIPALLFHGTADGTVPYTEGYPFGLPTITYVRGSQEINQQLNRTSIYHEFYSETGLGHEYWGTSNGTFTASGPNFYWTDIIVKSKLFLIGRMNTAQSCVNLATKLYAFSGNVVNNYVNLHWNTASEENLRTIIVERSADGINFEQLVSLQPKSGTGNGAAYSLTDDQPLVATSYYRLRLVDKDGHLTNSEILKFKTGTNVITLEQAYPNPVMTNLYLQVQLAKSQVVECAVYDFTGKLSLKKSLRLDEGMNRISIPFAAMPAGMYTVQFITDKGIRSGPVKVLKVTSH